MHKHKSKVMNALKKRFKTVLYAGMMKDGTLTFLADYKPVRAVVERNYDYDTFTTTIKIYQQGWVKFKVLTYK